MFDASRDWFGSFAEYSGGRPEDVDLDRRLGRKRQLHEDIPHPHEITAASLEHHEDNQCVFRALAELTKDPVDYIRAEFETIADRLDWGACPSHVEEWCKRRGLGMRWLMGKRLVRKTRPDPAVFRQTQTGRPWTLHFNSRDQHFWLYRKGAILPQRGQPTPRLRIGER